jgi:hypothetical protein
VVLEIEKKKKKKSIFQLFTVSKMKKEILCYEATNQQSDTPYNFLVYFPCSDECPNSSHRS